MAGSVKRNYCSPRREASAAATRGRIRDAATELFVDRGYSSTTMRDVARQAGVGERTLYDAFPTKAALFGHVLGVAIVGDEEPVAAADRPEFRAAKAAADPQIAIARTIQYATELLERAGDLIMASIEAAGSDPDMRAAADAGAAATHQAYLELTRGLHDRRALRDDLDPVTAADTMYALASPHVHQLLRRHRGWGIEQYRTWLERTVAGQLLR